MNAPISPENCHDLRQLATNLLGAITEYTLGGNMGQAQEASLQSRILNLTGNIRNLVAQPQDQWLLHIVQSNEMAAIRLFVHWHVFEHIPIGQSVSYAQLGDQVSVDLPLLSGKLPLSASSSMSFVASCALQPESWVAQNYDLFNIVDPVCTIGHDELYSLDVASNQPSCPHVLGDPVTLIGSSVVDILYVTR